MTEPSLGGQWGCEARAVKARRQHAPTKTRADGQPGRRAAAAARPGGEPGPEGQMQQTRACPSWCPQKSSAGEPTAEGGPSNQRRQAAPCPVSPPEWACRHRPQPGEAAASPGGTPRKYSR